MLVSFEQIGKLAPGGATSINGAINAALGPITGGTTRTSLYDSAWGYFLFGQTLRMEYRDVFTYTDYGEFTIEGEFTRNAEEAIAGAVTSNEDAKFNQIVAKYNALEATFTAAGVALAPSDFTLWGGVSDPRCIVLPYPLVDSGANRIYALPVSFELQESQWGNYIRYRAVLKEAKFAAAKVLINGLFIDDGVITITCPQPILTRSPLIGCAGELIQVKNYMMMELGIEGTVNGVHASGHSMTDFARSLMPNLIADKVNVGLARVTAPGTVTPEYPFLNMSLDEDVGIEIDYPEQVVHISVKAKAGTL